MHLESVASCKGSLQMKGGQTERGGKKKEEVKGRKQSEKKYRHKRMERRGGEGVKELKRSNSA